jgi:hypothetical protein
MSAAGSLRRSRLVALVLACDASCIVFGKAHGSLRIDDVETSLRVRYQAFSRQIGQRKVERMGTWREPPFLDNFVLSVLPNHGG